MTGVERKKSFSLSLCAWRTGSLHQKREFAGIAIECMAQAAFCFGLRDSVREVLIGNLITKVADSS